MAIVGTNLTSGANDSGTDSESTASISPTGNSLILAAVSSRRGDTTTPAAPTVSGNGLTWVQINTIAYDESSSSQRRLTVFRALGASPSTGTITFTFPGNQTDVAWSIDEFSGVDTSGTNGSGAIVQSAVNEDEAASSNSLTVTLSAFGSANNATYGTFATSGVQTPTAGTGFAILANATINARQQTITEWRNDNDRSVDISFPLDEQMGGIAIEIKAAVAAGTYVGSYIGPSGYF